MEPAPERTVVLTERTATACSLTPADLDFLLSQHRTRFEIVPADQAGWYRITPLGFVGVVIAPHCRFVLQPKIPVRCLLHLLDPLAELTPFLDRTDVAPGTEALNFLAGQLARLLGERLRAGLHQAYVERLTCGPVLQGRVDVTAQLRQPSLARDRLHGRLDEHTPDVPCNQLLKSTVEFLLRSPLLAVAVRALLQGCLRSLATIQSVPLDANSVAAAAPDPLTEAYRPLWDLCRFLINNLAPDQAPGPAPAPAFLLDMQRIFERYVTAGIEAAAGPRKRHTMAAQRSFQASEQADGQPGVHMRPDLTVSRRDKPIVVLDAKWKQLPAGALIPEDLYQAIAYATALGVRRAVLVYPGRLDRARRYHFPRPRLRIEIRRLVVIGTAARCRRSLAQLARATLSGC
jgi:5-methylcytosine-specific restriction enzyme subunit McrC